MHAHFPVQDRMLHEMLHADAQLADNVRVRLCLKIGRSCQRQSVKSFGVVYPGDSSLMVLVVAS